MPPRQRPVEWPTLAMLALCHAAWAAALFAGWPLGVAVPLAALAIALHGSLSHEVLHGHPFRSARLNAALVWLPLTLAIPFGRFRDTHLDHHRDPLLTDPYDDPETNYLDAAAWARLPAPVRALLAAHNTLAGRVLLGPVIGTLGFWLSDIRAARRDARVAPAWTAHLPPLALVLGLAWVAPMPLWAYGVAVYGALGLLRVRTFLEHRAHPLARARTAIVEDRGPLAWLFLNNNLHVVHHMHPAVPWYRLPALYAERRSHYLRRNEGYRYRSYAEIARLHLFRAKDPVAHPLWRRGIADPAPIAAAADARIAAPVVGPSGDPRPLVPSPSMTAP